MLETSVPENIIKMLYIIPPHIRPISLITIYLIVTNFDSSLDGRSCKDEIYRMGLGAGYCEGNLNFATASEDDEVYTKKKVSRLINIGIRLALNATTQLVTRSGPVWRSFLFSLSSAEDSRRNSDNRANEVYDGEVVETVRLGNRVCGEK
ncbi:hypothetical protein TSAR_005019 [Trichomalopsis sarcophagae]|uniref:Uncharacterized protein n=1 Tax=Trichomalopsis sarcophagae TaxID=543379 RepID=A0A232FBW4_9HYME|nr:hypothetical protein TSAR_005019 [Trichomalopsis sarcophagae]